MNFNEYQKKAQKTAIYPNQGNNLIYPVLGLCGEAGEVAEKIKKMIRDDEGKLTEKRRTLLISEISDVLWYLSAMATELGVSLDEVAEYNLKKLKDREERNKLQGDGDER